MASGHGAPSVRLRRIGRWLRETDELDAYGSESERGWDEAAIGLGAALAGSCGSRDRRSDVGGALTVAPGQLIAGRYRLEAHLPGYADGPATTLGESWRAHDDVLARPVAMLLTPLDDARAPQLLAGARATARLANPALARVYDAGESDTFAFVVTELLDGGSLEEQLRVAPLEPAAAVDLVAGVAGGVAAARAAGLAPLAPSPRGVLFSTTGSARLAGVPLAEPAGNDGGADRAMDGPGNSSQALLLEASLRSDTQALGNLLYAALTGRWSGPRGDSSLPEAPCLEGRLCMPRQVRSGVPRTLDSVVSRTIGDDTARHGLPEITSPSEFVAAIEPLRDSRDDGHPFGADTHETAPIISDPPVPGGSWLQSRGQRWSVVGVAAILVVGVLGLLRPGSGGYLHFGGHPAATEQQKNTGTGAGTGPSAAAPSAAAGAKAISAHSVVEFDPYGDHHDPHVAEASDAIDGNPGTAWHTQTFTSATFGNMKPGVGLLVDLGSARTVASVEVKLLADGTSLELFESDSAPQTEQSMTLVGSQAGAGPTATLQPKTPTKARYWLVWLTKLPASGSGGYASGITDVSFRP